MRDAAIHRAQAESPYYPPRERWYSRFWYPWYLIKRRLHLAAVTDGFELPFHKLLLGMTVPGLSWLWYGRPIFGLLTMASYCLMVITFLIWIGHPAGTVSLAILMSIHTSSILFMNRRLTPDVELWKRIIWSLVVFALVSLLVYRPLRWQMERRWFMALRVGERVLVVKTSASPSLVKRGDWVVYRITPSHSYRTEVDGGYARVEGGYGLGEVLAVAGDTISFQAKEFSINGVSRPRRAYMPASGNLVVADGSWFIWPDVTISGYGNVGADVTENAMTALAMVPRSNFMGTVFHRWWWRKQTPA
ncbi:MAG TPA: S26 family signal peptidase [Verrucomicrobiae bacterium]|nr:S26 family signal peptidase [Verrucomicrobiae bacterium]